MEGYSESKIEYLYLLSDGLQRQLSDGNFTDTKIKVGEKTFNCHRVILSASSAFFEAMYLSGMRECGEGNTVDLQGLDAETFEVILKFIYHCDDIVTHDNVYSLLSAASMLQIHGLVNKCELYMIQSLNKDCCIATWKLASMHGCQRVAKYALRMILQYFSDIWQTEDFLSLDSDDILSIINDNDLVTSNEETVCEAVLYWLKSDLDNRTKYVDKLFEHLRFPLMGPEYILEVVENQAFVRESETCREFIEEAKRYHLLQARRQEFVSTRLVHRNRGDYEEVIVCIGGNVHPERTTEEVWCYSIQRKLWSRLAYLPQYLGVEFAVCSHGNAIFISGGSELMDGMMYFLTTHNTWLECERMLIGRRRHCMVAVGDSLYVIGGFDDKESEERFGTLMSVERFGVLTGIWEDHSYLSVPVRSASAAVVRDKIYVFGGIGSDDEALIIVQCIDTRSRMSTRVSELPAMSGMSACVTCNRTAYLIFPGGNVLKMESNGEIEQVGTLPGFNRCGYAVVQHEGKILIMGGISDSEMFDDVVVFDPVKKEASAKFKHRLWSPLFGFGCAKAVVSKSLLN